MIGYIHPGASASFGIRPEFMQSVLSVLTDPDSAKLVGGVSEVSAGAVVPLARDVLTSRFLDSDCDWLWCVDTDMVFTPAVLTGLWSVADAEAVPVVSAVCSILDGGRVWPSAYELVTGDGEPEIARLGSLPSGGGLVRVAACGAACLLVHRDVFGRIAQYSETCRWWQPMEAAGVMLGEDVSFCLRAGACSIPVYVHTGAEAGHVKAVMIGTPTPVQPRSAVAAPATAERLDEPGPGHPGGPPRAGGNVPVKPA